MEPGTLVLLHSPLTTASAWGALPEALGPYDVVVPEITDDDRPPYAGRYVARAALEITRAGVRPPVVLVGHGGAGPLLPPVGAAQRAAHRLVGAYVFVDAELPPPAGSSRLDQAGAFGPEFAEALKDGGRFPDEEPQAGVTARRRDDEFFAEPLPMPQDWPDAPCGYLRTSDAYERQAAQARMRGWTVAANPGGHFAAVTDPRATARALTELIASL
ncbi:hypothetical protein GCM10023195_83940 [Actinoallomurus liliacearum]|uniref:Alpha/beta hydrolase n=1 Tax=Actinoallomurus liliacearum TaxID=1080073 RepID=A0ABP8U1B0_9ACTN